MKQSADLNMIYGNSCNVKFLLFLQDLKIYKAPGEKLGMSIKGGVKGTPANPSNKADEGIFISKVLLNFI